ncbi:MAG: ribonuclease Z [Clostridiales bacterium]|nr:ribonuclease Z [Clostridiales bacterium]
MLNITLLGTGGGMPIPNKFLSSALLRYQSRKILIDCGEGTQVAMRVNNTGFKSLDIICLTHGHGDHIFGLPGLLSTMANSGRSTPVTIIGPLGIKDKLEGLISAIGFLTFEIEILESPKADLFIQLKPQGLVVTEHTVGNSQTSDIILSTLNLDHATPCIAYSMYIPRAPKFHLERALAKDIPKIYWKRLQKGETVKDGNNIYLPKMVLGKARPGIKFSYVTDTRPIEAIPDFIHKSDLFICEGTYSNDEDIEKAINYKHMIFSETANLARLGKVKELWITHFSPSIEDPKIHINNVVDIFPDTRIGIDGLSKTLAYPNSNDSED